jgi:hypothetical protein
MQTAHGGMQGEQAQALVEAQHPVSVPAAACGKGPEAGPVAPMRDGANATGQALGLAEGDGAGPRRSAASHAHRAGPLEPCTPAPLAAALPAPQLRARALRCATQERPTPPTAEPGTRGECASTDAPEHSLGPHGNVVTLVARRQRSGHTRDRRYAAHAGAGGAWPLRASWLHNAAPRRTHWAISAAPAQEPWSQQLSAKMDPPAARAM